MNRKQRLLRNLGGTTQRDDPRFNEPHFNGPAQAEMRTAIVQPERLFRAVLFAEVERLRQDERELTRFFSHFFDPTTSADERATYVRDFQQNPPRVILGYPRATGSWPCFSIVLTSDEEAEPELLAKYVGQTLPDEIAPEGDQEYEGAFFEQVITTYVLAQSPDQCIYLYKLAKLVLFGARTALEAAGIIDPHYSGGELNPEEMYLPDNAFARALTIRFKAIETVPKLMSYRDGRRLRITGIFGSDVVVDGIAGGVNTYVLGEDDDG